MVSEALFEKKGIRRLHLLLQYLPEIRCNVLRDQSFEICFPVLCQPNPTFENCIGCRLCSDDIAQ